VLRLCERFPNWVKSPGQFYKLSEEDQALLLAYEFVRSSEEIELSIVPRL
jgi:hypothetical protein